MKLAVARAALLLLLVSSSRIASAAELNFRSESERVTAALNCARPKVTPASSGFGALYGCITGKAETVKFFINEAAGTGRVQNIKLMWNDWFKDIGYGLHADRSEAAAFVKAFVNLYAPELEDRITAAFFSTANVSFQTGEYRIAFTYGRGPAIDERLLTLEPIAGR